MEQRHPELPLVTDLSMRSRVVSQTGRFGVEDELLFYMSEKALPAGLSILGILSSHGPGPFHPEVCSSS